jgi:hypothetical protein
MHYKLIASLLLLLTAITGCNNLSQQKSSQLSNIEEGRNLVVSMRCNDCHTPGYLLRSSVPEEDWLVGETLGFRRPTGTTYPTNLRLFLNSMSEDNWVIFARQMRENAPMESVLLPKTPEQDLRAIYRFVSYLGPKGTPAPARLPAGVTPSTRYIEFPYLH